MTLLFLALAIVCGLAFLHPYIGYPLSLRWVRPLPIRRGSGGISATLVFCAYQEEKSVPEKIGNLRRIREVAPDMRFACYVDLSTDRTLELLRAESDLIEVHAATERTGKALGMRHLAKVCTTEVMIFTDANVMVDPDTVPNMLSYFADPTVGGVCGTLHYTNDDESPTARTSGIYWRLEERIKKLESASGSTVGADGSIFATRRALYPVVPSHLLDDFIVSMTVVFEGFRLISAPDVIAYERSASVSNDEFRRKRRIAARAYASHLYLWPRVRAQGGGFIYRYVSHRLLRWWGAPLATFACFFGILFVHNIAGWPAALVALLVAIGFSIVGPRTDDRFIGPAYEAVRALIATALGVWDALRGVRYQTWAPAQSR